MFDYSPRVFEKTGTAEHDPLNEVGRLHPIKMQVSLKAEPPNTASITIPKEDIDLRINQIIGLYTPSNPTDIDLYYVKKIQTDYTNGQQRQVTLEGVWGFLKDIYMVAKVKPSSMGGSTTKVSAQKALAYLFNKNDDMDQVYRVDWVLGTVDSTLGAKTQGWSFCGVNIQDAIGDVTDCLPKPQWQFRYDLATSTAYADLTKQPTTAACEVRETRNMKSLSVTVDKSGFYNILYPAGKNNKYISNVSTRHDTAADGVTDLVHTKNTKDCRCNSSIQTWGPVAAVKNNSQISDDDALCDWAFAELGKNCTPVISISCDAYEISQITGCGMDHLRPGTVCRIPLPQYGVTFQDRITEVNYSDLVADPMSCKLTLSNDRKTVASVFYQITGGRGGGSAKKDPENEEDHCNINNKVDNVQQSTTPYIGKQTAQWSTITIDGIAMQVLSVK